MNQIIRQSAKVITTTISIAFMIVTAEARPSTQSYTCEGVQALVNQHGKLVLNTTSSNSFRKFVKNRSFCDRFQFTLPHSVPTRDGSCKLNACFSEDK